MQLNIVAIYFYYYSISDYDVVVRFHNPEH